MNESYPSHSQNGDVARIVGAPDSSTAVPYFLALAVLLAMVYGGWKWWQVREFELNRSQAIAAKAIRLPVAEYELTERSGKPFRNADMRGKVWVATYFFTTCPGNCVRLNRNIQLMSSLPELKGITWVSITCDPDTDDLAALRQYADSWKADANRWLFCRADLEYTCQVALSMKVYLTRKAHQDYAIVVDKSGEIRGMFDGTSKSDCERLRTMLLQLDKEPTPPRENVVSRGKAGTSA